MVHVDICPQNKQLTSASDVYSFGVFLWEIGANRFPWQGKNQLGVRTLDMHLCAYVCKHAHAMLEHMPLYS